jgi:hypothetical protein
LAGKTKPQTSPEKEMNQKIHSTPVGEREREGGMHGFAGGFSIPGNGVIVSKITNVPSHPNRGGKSLVFGGNKPPKDKILSCFKTRAKELHAGKGLARELHKEKLPMQDQILERCRADGVCNVPEDEIDFDVRSFCSEHDLDWGHHDGLNLVIFYPKVFLT